MAGTGKIGLLKRDYGFQGRIVAQDLEPEWIEQAHTYNPDTEIHVCDAANMTWARDEEFDAIIVSPAYGNRMADAHNAQDGSKRYTYRHMLGRPLHPANTGQLQWGEKYREAHKHIWAECIRVLKPNGIFVLNIKDHIRSGKRIHVSEWHRQELIRQGLIEVDHYFVKTPGMRRGSNSSLRIEGEDIWVFRRPPKE